MSKWLCMIAVACCLAMPAGGNANDVPPPVPMKSETFTAGQVWRYQTRPSEPDSRVIIGKIEGTEELGLIVHVKITGLRVKSPASADGFASVMGHVPISEAALSESVTELSNEEADLTGFSDGYNTWLSAFRAGDAGVFTLSLADVVDTIEEAINQ